jgi:phosphoglucosamine mutase
MGAECHMLSITPNGVNINENCGSTHLEQLKNYVKINSMDAGIAFDGDADRCLAVDEAGNEVDGDFIMAIMGLELKRSGKLRRDTIVGTVMTNFGFTKFCEENSIRFIAAKVGDRYVLETINREGYSFGGEQSGHIIFRDFATTGDGQLTALLLLSCLKKSGKKLSELCRVMKRFPQHTVNIKATPEGKIAMFTDGDIKKIVSEAEMKLLGSGRIVVRPSGTEPLVRIMVECENIDKTISLCERVAKEISDRLSAY